MNNVVIPDYVECSICSNKPGSPTLCPICLYNRNLVSQLNEIIGVLLDSIIQSDRKVLGRMAEGYVRDKFHDLFDKKIDTLK